MASNVTPNIPGYPAGSPWYLSSINHALYLDEPSGNVVLRTGFSGDIIISGSVNIPGEVDAHITKIGTSGNLAVPWMPVSIDGNSNVVVSGNVNANITGGNVAAVVSGNVGITGNIAGITTLPPITGTITGNVNANITGGNVNAVVTQGTLPWIVSGNITANLPANAVVSLSSTQTDSFGRLRVSNPYTMFDTRSRYFDHAQFSSATTGAASVAYNANSSTWTLTVGTSNGDSIIRETTRVFAYQPGKSLLTMATFSMNVPKLNLRQRVGFFGTNNGIFFEVDGLLVSMVIRSSSSGVITETRIPQASWNGDRLDGLGGTTNPSGITLSPQYDQIFWTDVEWLGVGSVRCGFVINGTFYTCHTFHHANLAGNTTTYMTTAILPIRYELTNTSTTLSPSTMIQICSTVISEGGYTNTGSNESAGTGINPYRCVSKDVYYPIVSIRLAPTRLDAIVVPSQVNILVIGESYFRWVILKNATLTGATWTALSASGTVQIDTGARPNQVTGGVEIQSGYAYGRTINELTDKDVFQDQLGRTLAGVSDTYTLAVACTQPNGDVLAQFGWQELS